MPSWLAHFSETNLKTVEAVCRTNFLTNVKRNNIFKFCDGRSLVNECRLVLLAILRNFYHKLRYQPLGTMVNISIFFFHFFVSSKNFNTLSITKRFIFKRSRTVFLLLLENWQASNHCRLFVTR